MKPQTTLCHVMYPLTRHTWHETKPAQPLTWSTKKPQCTHHPIHSNNILYISCSHFFLLMMYRDDPLWTHEQKQHVQSIPSAIAIRLWTDSDGCCQEERNNACNAYQPLNSLSLPKVFLTELSKKKVRRKSLTACFKSFVFILKMLCFILSRDIFGPLKEATVLYNSPEQFPATGSFIWNSVSSCCSFFRLCFGSCNLIKINESRLISFSEALFPNIWLKKKKKKKWCRLVRFHISVKDKNTKQY